jgi:hypothetical protein
LQYKDILYIPGFFVSWMPIFFESIIQYPTLVFPIFVCIPINKVAFNRTD